MNSSLAKLFDRLGVILTADEINEVEHAANVDLKAENIKLECSSTSANQKLMEISSFISKHVTEVTDGKCNPVGHELHLTVNETEQLWKLVRK